VVTYAKSKEVSDLCLAYFTYFTFLLLYNVTALSIPSTYIIVQQRFAQLFAIVLHILGLQTGKPMGNPLPILANYM
jgi:hypothetical protein